MDEIKFLEEIITLSQKTFSGVKGNIQVLSRKQWIELAGSQHWVFRELRKKAREPNRTR